MAGMEASIAKSTPELGAYKCAVLMLPPATPFHPTSTQTLQMDSAPVSPIDHNNACPNSSPGACISSAMPSTVPASSQALAERNLASLILGVSVICIGLLLWVFLGRWGKHARGLCRNLCGCGCRRVKGANTNGSLGDAEKSASIGSIEVCKEVYISVRPACLALCRRSCRPLVLTRRVMRAERQLPYAHTQFEPAPAHRHCRCCRSDVGPDAPTPMIHSRSNRHRTLCICSFSTLTRANEPAAGSLSRTSCSCARFNATSSSMPQPAFLVLPRTSLPTSL
jgi:hypothetical protein